MGEAVERADIFSLFISYSEARHKASPSQQIALLHETMLSALKSEHIDPRHR